MRHFLEELNELQRLLLDMGDLVEAAIQHSVLCLTERDAGLAQEVLQNETRINRMEIENDDLAVRLLALHQPMARDLRFLTSAIKINNDLERMGDLAVNIVERSLALMEEPPLQPLVDIPQLAKLVQSMVDKSLDSFVERDRELARAVLRADDAVDDLRDRIYQKMTDLMQNDSGAVLRALNLIFVARNLERIADHATNIAEDVVFLVEGIDVRHHAESRDLLE